MKASFSEEEIIQMDHRRERKCSSDQWEVGIAFLVIEKSGKVKMIADSSDCPRMSEEQNALGAECILAPWYETLDGFLADCCRGKKYASDTGISDTVYVQGELVDLRMQLSQKELERYREIGQECARIVESVAKDARPGQTEMKWQLC